MNILNYKQFEAINPLDPYGEEQWDEDYDIIVERPGLLLKHKKGMGVMSWIISYSDDVGNEYWEYMKRQNPNQREFERGNKYFLMGLFIGKIMTEAYYEHFKV